MSELPSYLNALVEPTPSGIAKLFSTWDDLSIESQLSILDHVENGEIPYHLAKRIYNLAFKSSNVYIRYLAAMTVALSGLRTFRYRRSGTWVFASRNGTPLEETTVSRAWGRIKLELVKADVRPLTLHSLRHTFATLSLANGKSVKWVAGQLGHRDAALTLNVYAHALPTEEDDLSYLPEPGAVTTRHPDGANDISSWEEMA